MSSMFLLIRTSIFQEQWKYLQALDIEKAHTKQKTGTVSEIYYQNIN